MSTYPSIITTLTNPLSTQQLNSPSHSAIETAQNADITAIETFLGVEGASSTVGTLIYDIRSPGSNGGGHVQTANKGGTGYTSYTKGDVLVAQSSSTLTKLAITATDGLAIISDSTQTTGIKWGIPNNSPTTRIYSLLAVSSTISSSFTWAKPATLSYIVVQVQAGGNGGTSVAGNTARQTGGQAGAWAYKIIPASLLGATEAIQVGQAGLISSTLGGLSSFGLANASASILCTTVATGGNLNIDGGTGQPGKAFGVVGVGGDGGDSQLGRGGKAGDTILSGAGTLPTGYGSGGPSGASDNASNTSTPRQGMAGLVIVQEY